MGSRLRKLSAVPTDRHRTGWIILRRGDEDVIALLVGDGGVEWEPQAAQAPVFDGRITIEATDAVATVEWG
jgi:hypothetical protein